MLYDSVMSASHSGSIHVVTNDARFSLLTPQTGKAPRSRSARAEVLTPQSTAHLHVATHARMPASLALVLCPRVTSCIRRRILLMVDT